MKTELQEQLFESYPKIFARRHMSNQYTAMCYGIQCPDKWYDLIDALCAKIQEYTDQKDIICEANQVKTKFGGLRFYVTYSDHYIKGLVSMTEIMSLRIKE
jgi:hypothetical protein